MATNGLNLQTSGLTFTTSTVERAIINDVGRMGLGTLAPAAMLHVIPTGSTSSVRFESLASSSTDSNYVVADADGVLSTRDDVVTLDGTQTLTNKTINGSQLVDGSVSNAKLTNDDVTIGSTSITLGNTATTLAGLTSVTSTSFVGDLTGDVTGDLTGNADTATTLETARNFEISGDITASAVSFDGSGNVNLVASIDANTVDTAELVDGAVTTDKIADNNVTNAKLANSTMTFNAGGTDPVVSLGGTLNLTSSDGSVVINGNSGTDTLDFTVDVSSVDSFVTGGTINSPSNGTLRLRLNNSQSDVDITGFSFDSSGDSGVSTYYMGDTIDFNGGTGITTVDNNTGTITFNLDDTAVTTGNYGSASETVTLQIDQQGRITSASEQSISITASQVSDFNNEVLADVFTSGNFTDSSEINFTVTAGASVTAALIDSSIANARLVNDSVTITAGSGLQDGGSVDLGSSVTLNVDYAGADNVILASGAGTGPIDLDWNIMVSNASNNVDYYSVSDLPFSNNSGTVTSVAISGTDGIDVDSGSPITTSGTITLGLSNVPNSSLANSSMTYVGTTGTDPVVSLGSSLTFTSTDGSVVVTGNSGSDELDLSVSSSVNTNIYNADGTLSANRQLDGNGNTLSFTDVGFDINTTDLHVAGGQVGVGTNSPDASAVLEVASTTSGFLFPRMTEAQRLAIGTPATGLMVYQLNNSEGVYIYKSFGWVQVI